MNQTEQMREQEHYLLNRLRQNYAWLIRDGFTTSANNLDEAITEISRLNERVKELEQTLSHVKETPKNEHDSDDVLKRAKLVRLTQEVIDDLEASHIRLYRGLTDCWVEGVEDFANAIQDVMIKNNGGSN